MCVLESFRIIENKLDWRGVLHEIGSYDFYHTFDYHELSKKDLEKPILVLYQEGLKIIAIPFLLRKIFDTEYFDLTSVYGYAGPLIKNIDTNFNNTKFIQGLKSFFVENKIVSVFSRLHPFMANQNLVLNGLGNIFSIGKVVNIDIKKGVAEQRTLFSKTTKRYLNKTAKVCSVKLSRNKEDLKLFKELYYENMNRVNAHKSYYFSDEYFLKFIECKDFETDVLLAVLNETEEVISAAMIVKTGNFVQYHISGTKDKYLDLTPIRLLIDYARVSATEQGYEFFNLGGGLGGQEDSLFYFKSSFSKDFKDFEVWKCITDSIAYDNLSAQFSDLNSDQSFFPLYRNKGF